MYIYKHIFINIHLHIYEYSMAGAVDAAIAARSYFFLFITLEPRVE